MKALLSRIWYTPTSREQIEQQAESELQQAMSRSQQPAEPPLPEESAGDEPVAVAPTRRAATRKRATTAGAGKAAAIEQST